MQVEEGCQGGDNDVGIQTKTLCSPLVIIYLCPTLVLLGLFSCMCFQGGEGDFFFFKANSLCETSKLQLVLVAK